ncbi:MAG: hypothetical protein FVQ79_00350 [Planctomycetes bacterium]|nr:hypothetical protein [Planctomycetota bacterium]
MMLRMTPEQIGEAWDLIRPYIAQALPPTLGIDAQGMTNVLYSLLAEESQLWAYYGSGEDVERGKPIGLIMTVIMNEPVSKARYLLIYVARTISPSKLEDYEEALDKLRTFSEANNCSQILAYVENDTYVRKLERVGGVKISNLVRL